MFGTSRQGGVSRRALVFGGASMAAVGALAAGGLTGALAQEGGGTPEAEATPEKTRPGQALREKLAEYPYSWSATSPATHQGDVYTLTAENTSAAPVKLWVFTNVMDHRQHHNEIVIQEEFELAAGETRELTATNKYGTANHFSTRIATDAADVAALALAVMVVDANGQEAASFNQRAFMIVSREDLEKEREARREELRDKRRRPRRRRKHAGHDGKDDAAEDAMEDESDLDATPEA
jgi:hypothetical protein